MDKRIKLCHGEAKDRHNVVVFFFFLWTKKLMLGWGQVKKKSNIMIPEHFRDNKATMLAYGFSQRLGKI
jgi:hypothetical protein